MDISRKEWGWYSALILVADDDPGIRLVLHHRLEAAGYTVEEAGESQTALQGLLSNRHDVALLDIMMPGAGGPEVLSQARTEGSRTLIILITAVRTVNHAVEGVKRGAHDLLTTPSEDPDHVA